MYTYIGPLKRNLRGLYSHISLLRLLRDDIIIMLLLLENIVLQYSYYSCNRIGTCLY